MDTLIKIVLMFNECIKQTETVVEEEVFGATLDACVCSVLL